MAKYLLSVHTGVGVDREPMTNDEMERSFAPIARLEEEMKGAEALIFSGRLHGPETATVVRESNGKVLTTDGPYAEAKEQIGGFYIINAADLDAALDWASKTTAAVGMPIEVRPFWDSHGA
jgi:hypothetical protein